MNVRHLPRLSVVAALSLTALAAACTSAAPAPPAQPLPTQPLPISTGAASPSPAPAASPSTEREPVRVTVRPATQPAPAATCRGAVIHRLTAADTGPPWKPLCMAVGGVLVVTDLGPEGFSVSSPDKVECHYEAAVRQCRLLHPGTVTFTIVNASQTRTLTLRIVKAAAPHVPAPACLAGGKTFVIDAAEGGPQGRPVCMRTSGTVRVVNLGPEGFQASPAGAVRCSYEGGTRDCRFTGPGTVTFTTTHGDSAPRTQKVVAIR